MGWPCLGALFMECAPTDFGVVGLVASAAGNRRFHIYSRIRIYCDGNS
jgi:hypothetical protein